MDATLETLASFVKDQGLALALIVWAVWFFQRTLYPDIRRAAGALGELGERAVSGVERIADSMESFAPADVLGLHAAGSRARPLARDDTHIS